MRTADFEYALPHELIAQKPTAERDQSRLLVLQRPAGRIAHRGFCDVPEYLKAGDVLVLNDSRVMAARLRGAKSAGTGNIEVLLVEQRALNDWWVMLRPGKRVRPGTKIFFANRQGQLTGVNGTVIEKNEEGHCRIQFSGPANIVEMLDAIGEVPLPPYIARDEPNLSGDDRERYQTVYALSVGSVAAPTAGLHFTERLLDEIRSRGVEVCFITLHVGPGTFAPVKCEHVERHVMHAEHFYISTATARAINDARRDGRRVVAVGTTTLRVLESVAAEYRGPLAECSGATRVFIYPPYDFKIVDALLTNFHLPRSTLLMLVSAFVTPGRTRGREVLLAAYAEAIGQRYRFYSYGDAMLIL